MFYVFMGQNKYQIPYKIVWITIILCILPALLNLMGIDFSSHQQMHLDTYRSFSPPNDSISKIEFSQLIRESFINTILITISISIAFLTVILAFVDYSVKRDITTPVVGIALFCWGIMDFFHILVSNLFVDHTSNGAANTSGFIWLLSSFSALSVGVAISVKRPEKYQKIPVQPKWFIRNTGVFVFLFIIAVSLLIFFDYIPKVIFVNTFIPRPYDFALIFIYLSIGLFVFPRFYQKHPSVFSQTLWLSLLPAIATQLYISLGSISDFDNCANIAYFMRSVTYFIPFVGLSLNYLQSHKNEKNIINQLRKVAEERKKADDILKGVLHSSLSGIMAFKSVKDENNIIVDFVCVLANPQAEKILGKKLNSIIGKKVQTIFPQMKQSVFEKYISVVATGQPEIFEYCFHQENVIKWFQTSLVAFGDGAAITFYDISERKNAEVELFESKQKFEAIFNQTYQFISLLSSDGTLIDANQATLDFTGIEKTNLIGTNFGDLQIIAINENLNNAIKNAAAGNFVHHEFEYLSANSQNHTIDLSIKPILNENGAIALLIAEGRDITERKHAEKELKKSETLLSESESMAHLGSWEWDLIDDTVTWSDELYRIFGYEPGEYKVQYESFINHIHPEDIELFNFSIQDSFLNEESSPYKYRIKQSSGQIRTLYGKCRVLTDAKGGAIKILGSSLDISEQNESSQKILASEGLYRTLANNIPDSMVMLYDNSLRYTLVDGSAEYNFGRYKSNEIIGKGIKEVLSVEQYNNSIAYYLDALKGLENVTETEENGRYYKVHFMPVKNTQGEIFSGMVVAHDITELKQYQKELELRIEELNRSNTDLEQFAYVASHDLQEPLRKIQAFGDRLSLKFKEELGDDGKNYIERMLNASARMQILIDDLLTFSRLTRSKEPFVKLDLQSILNDVLIDLEITIENKEAVIKVEDFPSIFGIPGQIRQLFQNMLSNALKFSKNNEAPVIKIRSEVVNGKNIQDTDYNYGDYKYCRIYIQDNGIGFEKKYLDRIFVIFQRLHGRNDYQGSGIGLAVCKKIVENHRGFITAESTLNQGSSFIITIPLKQHKDNDQLTLSFSEIHDSKDRK